MNAGSDMKSAHVPAEYFLQITITRGDVAYLPLYARTDLYMK